MCAHDTHTMLTESLSIDGQSHLSLILLGLGLVARRRASSQDCRQADAGESHGESHGRQAPTGVRESAPND